MKKNILCGLLAALILTAAASLALAEIHPLPIDQGGGYPVSENNLIKDGEFFREYQDESIHVTVKKVRYRKTECMVAHIKIAHPSQLRTAMSFDSAEHSGYVAGKVFPKAKNAVLTVNGDFFKYYNKSGYLVRQGELLRDRPGHDKKGEERDVLMIDENGDFYVVEKPTEESVHQKVAELEAAGHRVINSFNFGPTLVLDGEVCPDINTELFQGRYKMMRMAIGQLGPLEYAIYYCDGENGNKHFGLNLKEMAAFIAEQTPGVRVAYNLDGGGSTHLFVLEEKVQKTWGKRDISDVIYFASASDENGSKRAEPRRE